MPSQPHCRERPCLPGPAAVCVDSQQQEFAGQITAMDDGGVGEVVTRTLTYGHQCTFVTVLFVSSRQVASLSDQTSSRQCNIISRVCSNDEIGKKGEKKAY